MALDLLGSLISALQQAVDQALPATWRQLVPYNRCGTQGPIEKERPMQVKDYMRTQITTVTPETLVSTAYQLMTLRGSRIRHLPVVTRQNVCVGMLTDRDVRQAGASDAPSMAEHELTYLLEKLRVRDIMTQDVVTVRGTTP